MPPPAPGADGARRGGSRSRRRRRQLLPSRRGEGEVCPRQLRPPARRRRGRGRDRASLRRRLRSPGRKRERPSSAGMAGRRLQARGHEGEPDRDALERLRAAPEGQEVGLPQGLFLCGRERRQRRPLVARARRRGRGRGRGQGQGGREARGAGLDGRAVREAGGHGREREPRRRERSARGEASRGAVGPALFRASSSCSLSSKPARQSEPGTEKGFPLGLPGRLQPARRARGGGRGRPEAARPRLPRLHGRRALLEHASGPAGGRPEGERLRQPAHGDGLAARGPVVGEDRGGEGDGARVV